jgi:hypothetical protein
MAERIVMLNVVSLMLSVTFKLLMLIVVMLNVVMLNVVMLSVVSSLKIVGVWTMEYPNISLISLMAIYNKTKIIMIFKVLQMHCF